jgi:hypothetical protein
VADQKRTAGWLPLSHIHSKGERSTANALEKALAQEGREDRHTHGFHTYPAGLHPETARALLEYLPGDTLYDPFCGGGTSLVEGMLDGRETYGSDISPVAIAIANARTRLWTPERITKFRSASRRIAKEAQENEEFPPPFIVARVKPWYEPHVALELEGIRRGIAESDPEVRPALELVLSSILIKVSLRRSDTSPQRVERTRPLGTTAILFHKKARELGRRWEALAADVPEETPQAQLHQISGLEGDPPGLVHSILTSPPYPGVYDYLPFQQLRLAWLNWDSPEIWSQEMGSRRAFLKSPREALFNWNEDLRTWLTRVPHQLHRNGRAAIVIGDGVMENRVISVLKPLRQEAKDAGLKIIASASGGRQDMGTGLMREEHILLVEKS